MTRGLGFVAGGALFWLMYFDLKDRLQPEPRRLLLGAFVLGGVSAVAALGLYRLGELAGLPETPGRYPGEILRYCLGVVGPVEEGAKFLAVWAVVFRWRAFDEPIDGLIYAAAVAIGFATFENVLYLPYLEWPAQLARAAASPLTHSLFAAIWGLGLSLSRYRARSRRGRAAWQILPLVAAMAVHGLYDFALIAWHATFVASAIVLLLWVAMILYVRRGLPRGRV